jgi:hypothetical protein
MDKLEKEERLAEAAIKKNGEDAERAKKLMDETSENTHKNN